MTMLSDKIAGSFIAAESVSAAQANKVVNRNFVIDFIVNLKRKPGLAFSVKISDQADKMILNSLLSNFHKIAF